MLKPYRKFSVLDVTQAYHDGHRAIDCVPKGIAYGTPLVAPEKCKIEEIRTPSSLKDEFNDLANGYGVWMVGLETNRRYLYWHTLPVLPVWGGDIVEKGQIVAYVGNSGNVYTGGVYVPLDVRDNEPHLGTHLHLAVQVDNVPVDPIPLLDVITEPTYTIADQLVAAAKCLGKIKLLIK